MTLKYAGPKPMISQHGINFKDGKEDKYVYLMIAIQILEAIKNDTDANKHYSYNTNTKRLSNEQMQSIIQQYHPNLEKTMNKEIDNYLIHLDDEYQAIKNNQFLSDIERKTYLENLKIMKEYRTQRAKNKIFYIHAVQTVAEVIKANKIKKITTPFFEKFWHTLQTIQGQLARPAINLKSDIKIIEDNGLIAVLTIVNNG
jgi:hypothetical protein